MSARDPAPLITALDHIVLLCPDLDEGVADYTAIMGRGPIWRTEAEGQHSALFATQNAAVELVSPLGSGPVVDRLESLIDRGEIFASLVYRTDNLDAALHTFTRRGLNPGEITRGESHHLKTGDVRRWRRFRLDDSRMAGIRSFILEPTIPVKAADISPGSVSKLDHLVIRTSNPDRAVANYGGRLGLRFALDRTAEQWDTRFLFFRIDGLSIEIVQRLSEPGDPADPDRLWGLTWATDDLEALHQRLVRAGRSVSEIRAGRKPGSRVFTLRDANLGVPTLFIAHAAR